MPNYFTELQNGPSGPSYEVKDKEADHSITALIEESPATEAHAIDTYLVYNHEIYQVKVVISIGDTLTVGTNIEVADIPDGTIIFTDDESSAPAGCVAHVIVNDSGITMAQRNKLKFVGLDLTDDSENDTTVISNRVIKSSGYQIAITTDSKGDAQSDTFAALHPNVNIIGVIPCYCWYRQSHHTANLSIVLGNNQDIATGKFWIKGSGDASASHNIQYILLYSE